MSRIERSNEKYHRTDVERITMLDGQPLTVGNMVRLGCYCHTNKEGIVRGFSASDLAIIELESGETISMPSHLLDII